MGKHEKGTFGSWTWRSGADRYEVILTRSGLHWSWEGPKDQGGVSGQALDDFLANGPLDRDVPDAILAEITTAVQARQAALLQPPLDDRPRPESGASVSAHSGDPAHTDTIQRPPPRPRQIIGAGLALIAGGTLLCGLAAYYWPGLGGYSAVLPLLAGFAAFAILRSWQLVVAGLLAFGSAVVAVSALPLYLSAQRVQPPAYANDLRARAEYAGTHEFASWRQSGASRVQQSNRAHAAPLTGTNWSTVQPVGLWLVCSTSPGFSCLPRTADRIVYVRPIRPEDGANLMPAVRNAALAHRLSISDRPRLVEIARPQNALRMVLLAPAAAAVMFAGLILVTMRRRPAA